MTANNSNTVTNVQESFFRATTKTSVTIEAVNPEPKVKEETKALAEVTPEPKAKKETKAPAEVTPEPKVKEETKAPAEVTPEPKVKEETKAPVVEQANHSDLLWKIPLGILLLLLILAAGLYLGKQLGTLPGSASAPASAPAMAPVSPSSDGALESPDLRSAGSNENFIGYFGSRGAGWIVPNQTLDTSKATRDVGSVLFTWCETRSVCFYQILKPGDTITTGHQGSQINIYSKEYMGLEANELQYIATEANTSWTAVK